MKQNLIILYAKPYRVVNEDGTVNEGVTIVYYPCDNLSPLQGEDGSRGMQTLQQSFSMALFKNIQVVPALYEVEFGLKPIKNSAGVKVPGVVPIGLKFVSDFAIKK